MDPMECGPLGGSVTTVTEYTGSVDTLSQVNIMRNPLSLITKVYLGDIVLLFSVLNI